MTLLEQQLLDWRWPVSPMCTSTPCHALRQLTARAMRADRSDRSLGNDLRRHGHVQNWEDEEVGTALEWLKEKLADDIKLLSSWDKYKKEVLSGSLEWSPMHTAEQFWLENSPKFEERDCQVRLFP